MTLRRDPFTPAGAWCEAARLLSEGGFDGWEVMAEALGKPVSTIRKYADPGRSPPADDMVTIDRDVLKPRGHPPVCTIAMGEAIGDAPNDPLSRLNDAGYKIGAMIRMIEGRRDEDVDFHKAVGISSKITNQLSAFTHYLCRRRADAVEAKGDGERPKLWGIAGGRGD